MKNRILIVEDDVLLLNVLKEYLELSGYKVSTAENAQSGLEAFLNKPSEAVITDINMPGVMSGIDVVRRIKAFKPDTRIIVCTGYSNDLSSIENVAHQVIKKPFNFEEIRKLLPKLN